MPVLADLPHPAPGQGLVYLVDDAWPGSPAPAGFVISDWNGDWQPIPFASLAGFLLINKGSTADMKTYLSVTTSDVTGLSTALAAKAALVHTHAQSDITGLAASLAAKEDTISAGTTSQYWRGDKSWQTLNKAAVGLGNVDNTSDANKPISVAVQTALDGKAANVIGAPTSRSLSLATAYQASNPAKPAIVTLNLNSTASLSLTAGTTNTAQVVIGSTTAVATGTGTVVGDYSNSLTGTLVVGLAINTAARQPITIALPVGWYFAVRQTSGAVTITSAFDQSVG